MFHLVGRQGLLHWTSFRWDLRSISSLYHFIRIANYLLCSFVIKFAASDEHPRQFLSMPEDDLQMVLSQVTDQNLRHTLQFGIGLHHAGLNDKDRSLVEELFFNNKIQAFFYDLITLSWLICWCHLWQKINYVLSSNFSCNTFQYRFWFVLAHWHGV